MQKLNKVEQNAQLPGKPRIILRVLRLTKKIGFCGQNRRKDIRIFDYGAVQN